MKSKLIVKSFKNIIISIVLVISVVFIYTGVVEYNKEKEKKSDRIKMLKRVSTNIIYDIKTGLYWQDNDDAKKVSENWEDAKVYCQELSLDGYNDWRLPSKFELDSIVYIKNSPAIIPVFKNIAPKYYWSSTYYANEMAFVMNFSDGCPAGHLHNMYLKVRCVRSGQ